MQHCEEREQVWSLSPVMDQAYDVGDKFELAPPYVPDVESRIADMDAARDASLDSPLETIHEHHRDVSRTPSPPTPRVRVRRSSDASSCPSSLGTAPLTMPRGWDQNVAQALPQHPASPWNSCPSHSGFFPPVIAHPPPQASTLNTPGSFVHRVPPPPSTPAPGWMAPTEEFSSLGSLRHSSATAMYDGRSEVDSTARHDRLLGVAHDGGASSSISVATQAAKAQLPVLLGTENGSSTASSPCQRDNIQLYNPGSLLAKGALLGGSTPHATPHADQEGTCAGFCLGTNAPTLATSTSFRSCTEASAAEMNGLRSGDVVADGVLVGTSMAPGTSSTGAADTIGGSQALAPTPKSAWCGHQSTSVAIGASISRGGVFAASKFAGSNDHSTCPSFEMVPTSAPRSYREQLRAMGDSMLRGHVPEQPRQAQPPGLSESSMAPWWTSGVHPTSQAIACEPIVRASASHVRPMPHPEMHAIAKAPLPQPPPPPLPPPPRATSIALAEATAKIPNVGSARHHLRSCKPCAFVNLKGCRDGVECRFCHLCDMGEKKRRKKERAALRRASREWPESADFCQEELEDGEAWRKESTLQT